MPVTVTTVDALPAATQEALSTGVDRAVCPRCAGGTSRETSLSIRAKDDGVVSLWCFRSTCGFKALVVVDPNAVVTRTKLKEARVYDKPTVQITGAARDRLIVDYNLRQQTWGEHGWRMSEDGDEFVLPVRDPYGLDRGLITRSIYQTPKRVYTYKATSLPFLDYWLNDSTAPVVVVEDALSACRLSGLGYNAVALLGTGMSREDATELARVTNAPRILALDRDAFDKAMKLRERHAHVLKIDKVLCLTEDIKNMENDDDIRELIDGRRTTSSGHLQG